MRKIILFLIAVLALATFARTVEVREEAAKHAFLPTQPSAASP